MTPHINMEQTYFFDFLFLLKFFICPMSRGHIYEEYVSTQVGGGTLPTPKLETIFNTQLAPIHQTKLPTQEKQNVKKIKNKAFVRTWKLRQIRAL
jgi:hypothetical protein